MNDTMNSYLPRLTGQSPLESIRRYVRQRTSESAQCELCSARLTHEHAHLVELASRRLCCVCDPCAILFGSAGATKFRRVPRQVQLLTNFRLADVDWENLHLPINLAFFVYNSAAKRVVALYPSPGGATEALPPLDAWQTLVDDNPCLSKLEPDVEALLVNRLGPEPKYFMVGIDECFTLVGLVRMHWRGLSGGTTVWSEIDGFFTGLKARSRPESGKSHD